MVYIVNGAKFEQQKENLIAARTYETKQSETAQETSLQEEGDIGNNIESPPTSPPPVPSVDYPAQPSSNELPVSATVSPETVPSPIAPVPASIPTLPPLPALTPSAHQASAAEEASPLPAWKSAPVAADDVAVPDSPAPVEPQLPACPLCGQPGIYYPEHMAYWCETCQQWLQ